MECPNQIPTKHEIKRTKLLKVRMNVKYLKIKLRQTQDSFDLRNTLIRLMRS